MAPRIVFGSQQGVIGSVKSSGVLTPIRHKKHLQQTPMTTQKAHRLLRQEMINAVKDGDLERVTQLIQHVGPDVNRESTLLHVAADNNQPHVASFLLRFISPNAVNLDGYTPAHLAAMKGHTQVLRKLFSDAHLDASKRDPSGNTYTHWLCVPLFEAVLKWDKVKIQNLLSVGADPDMEAKRVVGGTLVRELRVTTARQLALALGRELIVTMFEKNRALLDSCRADPEDILSGARTSFHQLPMGSMRLQVAASTVAVQGPDMYQTDASSPGYVCILNYGTFKDRQDLQLEGSEADTNNFASVFSKMGYSGHAHVSLTADQTRQELVRLRDMEEVQRAGCVVVIVSSHGTPHQQFLTSDMELLDTHWVLDLFKDSQCPHLKDKPKLFIWDLCYGYYEEKQGRARSTSDYGRVDEPLRNVLCLHSSSGAFTTYSFTRDGTPFVRALCRTLARHAHQKEFQGLYREFLGEYSRAAPGIVPQLTNIGFSKKFYFNPRPESNLQSFW